MNAVDRSLGRSVGLPGAAEFRVEIIWGGAAIAMHKFLSKHLALRSDRERIRRITKKIVRGMLILSVHPRSQAQMAVCSLRQFQRMRCDGELCTRALLVYSSKTTTAG